MQNKSVQIPYELFFQLLQYFLMDNYDGNNTVGIGEKTGCNGES